MRVYIYGTSLRGVHGVGTRTLYLDSRHEEQPDFPMTSICELIQAIFICYIVLRVLALGFARLFFFLHAFCLKTNTKQKQPLLHNFTIVIYSRIRHKPRDQKFWETSQNSFVMFPDFISNICTTKEPRKKKKKKEKLFIACQVLPRAGQQYLSTKTAPVHSAAANNSSALLV